MRAFIAAALVLVPAEAAAQVRLVSGIGATHYDAAASTLVPALTAGAELVLRSRLSVGAHVTAAFAGDAYNPATNAKEGSETVLRLAATAWYQVTSKQHAAGLDVGGGVGLVHSTRAIVPMPVGVGSVHGRSVTGLSIGLGGRVRVPIAERLGVLVGATVWRDPLLGAARFTSDQFLGVMLTL